MIQTLQQMVSTLATLLVALQATVSGVPASSQLAQVIPVSTINLSPSSVSANVNSTFTVSLVLSTGGQNAYGIDINKLRFNPAILQVVDADAVTSGVQISAGSLMPLTIINSVDNTLGTIQFSQLATPGSTFNGSGTLATVNFRAVSAGVSNVTLDFISGSGTDTNVAGLGGDLLSSVGNGSYTGLNSDTTGPVISSILSSSVTQTGATISWNTNENSDTQVEYGITTSYGSQSTLNSSLITSHSANITGLIGGTLYHYRVKSRDSTGNLSTSVDNTFTTITPADTTSPTAPGTPTLSIVSSSAINLSWVASTDAVGVTGYRVERCSGSATCTTYVQISTPTSNSYSDTGLTASTIYRYRIRAVDAAGNLSSYSTASNATTLAPPDATAPTISSLILSNITTNAVTISWNTNESSDTQVEYGLTTSYGNSSTLNSSLITSHLATITGLSAGTSYHYRIKSRDASGNLATSLDNTFTTQTLPDTTAPSVPAGLSVSPTSSSQIQVSWNPSVDSAGAGQSVSGLSYYQVYRGSVIISTTTQTAFLDTSLVPGTTYSYQITSVDNVNNISTKSILVSTTTPLLSLSVQRRIVVSPEGSPVNQRNVSGTIEFKNPISASKIFQASFVSDLSGNSIIDVPAGLLPTVNFRSVVPGYLSKIVTGINLTDTAITTVTFPTLPSGDFNNDQLINSLDFSVMNSNWNLTNSLSDINKDGFVNSLDFAFLSNNWLLSGE